MVINARILNKKGEIKMNKIMKRIREKKGFTLAELLIVVAIIAVLVAIATPVFSKQLEKSREATDQANIRAGYAQIMTEYLEWDGTSAIDAVSVPAHQTQAKWQCANDADKIKIADAGDVGAAIEVEAKTSGSYSISINTATGIVTVN